MAERSVIREDVVSIAFEVGDNPFKDLTAGIDEIKAKLGILDTVESEFKNVGQEAGLAGEQLEDASNALRGPPANGLADQVDEVRGAADGAKEGMEELEENMQDVARQKLTDGIEKLKAGIKAPVEGLKNLAGQAKDFAKEKLDAGVQKLPKPLQIAGSAAGLVLGKAKDLAAVGFQKAAAGMKSLADHAGRAAKALGGKLLSGAKALGRGVVTGITAGSIALAGIGTAAVTVGAGFEASMSQVAATMGMTADEADYSNEVYAQLANTAKEMGATTKFSASEAGDALNYLALAGYDADKACAALPTILNLASAGGMELAAASDMITDSMSALGLSATKENLTQFGDQLAKTAQKSNTSVSQLGEAILTVGGTAKTLSGGTTEMNTLLGILADNGVKGAEGGTALRNILLSLQAPTDTAAKAMKKLGLNVYDAEGKMRPVNEVLGDLNAAMGSMNDQAQQELLSTMFNKRDLKSVSALLSGTVAEVSDISTLLTDKYQLYLETDDVNHFSELLKTSSGDLKVTESLMNEFGLSSEEAGEVVKDLQKSIPRFDLLSGYINDSNGAMANMAETMNDNLTGRVTEFKSAAEGAGIAFYEALGSSNLKDLVKQASGWVTELTRATEAGGIDGLVEQAGTTLSHVLLTVTGYLPQLIQSGSSVIHSLVSGIMQNRDQIASSVVGGFTNMIQGVLTIGPEVIALGGTMLLSLVQGLEQQLPGLIPVGLSAIRNLCDSLLQNAPAMIESGINIALQLIDGLIDALPTILTTGITLVIYLAQGLVDAIPDLIQAVPKLIAAIVETLMSINWLEVGLDIVKGIGKGIWDGIKGIFGKNGENGKELTQSIAQGMDVGSLHTQASAAKASQGIKEQITQTDLQGSGQELMKGLATGLDAGAALPMESADLAATKIQQEIDNTDLYSSGQNIMQGLNNGMLSMEGTLNATAGRIGTGISQSLNRSLDIHSPSRVTEETGEFTGLGLVKGLEGTKGKVQEESRRIGEATGQDISLFSGQYTPETDSQVMTRQSNTEINHFNPTFNLTLNGASASDSNERKVKRWIKESINEWMAGIERSQPVPREV